MYFEGLPQSHLGGTVLLSGPSQVELTKLKEVASLLLFACYNWRLEKSFLMNEFAQPPTSKVEFFDDSRENSPVNPKCVIQETNLEGVEKISQSGHMQHKTEDCEKDNYTYETKKDGDISDREKTVDICLKITDMNITELNFIGDRKKYISPEIIDDYSDPLHSYNNEGNITDASLEKLSVSELPFSNNFRKSLDDTILCISPYLVFMIPYLETESGKKCKLRNFFPCEIFYSEQFCETRKRAYRETDAKEVKFEDRKLKVCLMYSK